MHPTPRTLARTAIVAAASLPLVAAAAPPAEAGTRWSYRSSGIEVTASWLEVGTLAGVPGNAHVGNMTASTNGSAYGSVVDWTCPEGELPPTGGGGHPIDDHDEYPEEPETNCVVEAFREIYAEGTLTVRIKRDLSTARITGQVTVSDHETGTGGAPAVDMTVTGVGGTWTETTYGEGNEGGSRYRYKFSSTYREGSVTGAIGAMGFTDDADDQSSALFRRWTEYERSSYR